MSNKSFINTMNKIVKGKPLLSVNKQLYNSITSEGKLKTLLEESYKELNKSEKPYETNNKIFKSAVYSFDNIDNLWNKLINKNEYIVDVYVNLASDLEDYFKSNLSYMDEKGKIQNKFEQFINQDTKNTTLVKEAMDCLKRKSRLQTSISENIGKKKIIINGYINTSYINLKNKDMVTNKASDNIFENKHILKEYEFHYTNVDKTVALCKKSTHGKTKISKPLTETDLFNNNEAVIPFTNFSRLLSIIFLSETVFKIDQKEYEFNSETDELKGTDKGKVNTTVKVFLEQLKNDYIKLNKLKIKISNTKAELDKTNKELDKLIHIFSHIYAKSLNTIFTENASLLNQLYDAYKNIYHHNVLLIYIKNKILRIKNKIQTNKSSSTRIDKKKYYDDLEGLKSQKLDIAESFKSAKDNLDKINNEIFKTYSELDKSMKLLQKENKKWNKNRRGVIKDIMTSLIDIIENSQNADRDLEDIVELDLTLDELQIEDANVLKGGNNGKFRNTYELYKSIYMLGYSLL